MIAANAILLRGTNARNDVVNRYMSKLTSRGCFSSGRYVLILLKRVYLRTKKMIGECRTAAMQDRLREARHDFR